MRTYQSSTSLLQLAPKAILLLSILTLGISILLFMDGYDAGRLSLLIASILSLLVLVSDYARITGRRNAFNNHALNRLNHMAGYIPYVFGFYLMAVQGFWSLSSLLDGFSVTIITLAIFYIVCGNAVVSAGYQCTLLVEQDKA